MSVAARRSIELYYDVISPHAWIAFELLSRYKTSSDVAVTLTPFSVSELRQRSARLPLPRDRTRLGALCRDAEKLAERHDIPLKTPHNMEEALCRKGSLPAMRLLTAISQTRPELTEDFSRSLWDRLWHKNEDISQRKSLIQLGEELGQSPRTMESLLEKTKERCTTSRLRAVTDEAMERGAQDAPTIVVTGADSHQQILTQDIQELARLLEENYEEPKVTAGLS